MAGKNKLQGSLMLVLAVVGLLALGSFFGVLDLSKFGVTGGAIIPQSPLPGSTSSDVQKECSSETVPVLQVNAFEQFAPIATLTAATIDVNVFQKATGSSDYVLFRSGYNGSATTQTVSLQPETDTFFLAGRDKGSSDYYTIKSDSFNSNCTPLIVKNVSLAREGSITNTYYNNGQTTANATTALADINQGDVYVWTVNTKGNNSQTSFGSPSSSKKVNLVVDYNALEMESIKVLYKGQTFLAGSGVIPPTITRDSGSTAQVAFTLPFLGVSGGAFVDDDWTIEVKALSTMGNTDKNATGSGYSRFTLHYDDYSVFVNQNNQPEENVYNSNGSADVGTTTITDYTYYK